jgi:hypothetical protein
VDEYLRRCDEQAAAVRRKVEEGQATRPTKEDLLDRAKAKGLNQ